MKIKESGENYLETILLLTKKSGFVRAVDVAGELGYAKASVSRALGILKREGYIKIGENGQIVFTELGKFKAESIYDRHRTVAEFLIKTLKIDAETAQIDACKVEHILSEETFSAMKKYLGGGE